MDNLLELAGAHRLAECVQIIPQLRSKGGEQPPAFDVVAAGQAVLHKLGHAFLIGTAVLFAHAHGAADDLDARLEPQKVGPQRHNRRTAAAFGQVIEPVEQKAGFYAPGQAAQRLAQGVYVSAALFSQPAGFQDDLALPHRQVFRIDDAHILKLAGRDARVAVARGKAVANGDMDDGVIFPRKRPEQIKVFADADGRGAAQRAAGVHMGENIVGRDVDAVGKGGAVFDNVQRR